MIDELAIHPRVLDELLSLKCAALDVALRFERRPNYGCSVTLNGTMTLVGAQHARDHQFGEAKQELTLIELVYNAGTRGHALLRVTTDDQTQVLSSRGLAWCIGEHSKLSKLMRILTAESAAASGKDEEARQNRLEQEAVDAAYAKIAGEAYADARGTDRHTLIMGTGAHFNGQPTVNFQQAVPTLPCLGTAGVTAATPTVPAPRRGILRSLADAFK